MNVLSTLELLNKDTNEFIEEYDRIKNVLLWALNKQSPKKPLLKKGKYICLNCSGLLGDKSNFAYCPFCGQFIDWR